MRLRPSVEGLPQFRVDRDQQLALVFLNDSDAGRRDVAPSHWAHVLRTLARPDVQGEGGSLLRAQRPFLFECVDLFIRPGVMRSFLERVDASAGSAVIHSLVMAKSIGRRIFLSRSFAAAGVDAMPAMIASTCLRLIWRTRRVPCFSCEALRINLVTYCVRLELRLCASDSAR